MIDLGKIKQGERGTLAISWEFPDSLTSPASISGGVVTAVMENLDTGDVTAVTGTLTATATTAATWELSAGDSGTYGTYFVTFQAIVGGVTTYTLNAKLEIEENPAATASQNPALVSVSVADAAWVSAGAAGGAVGSAAYVDTIDEDNMASDSAAHVPTQQSVKAYVDTAVSGVASDVGDLTTAGLTAANMLRVASGGGLEERTPAEVLGDIGAETSGAAAAVQGNLDDLIDLLTPAAAVLSASAEYITINLSWTYTPVGEYTGFKLYRKIGSGGSFALLDTLVATETDYTDSGLSPEVEYFYRLDAYNVFFAAESNVASTTTEALDFDFTAMSDGALPAVFTAPTFAIAGARAINTPLLGSELLTDPGLEANYTAGKCNTLTKAGSPTLAESADVHGGSKAQGFIGVAVANAVNWATVAGVAGNWYQFSAWAKRTAGTAGDVALYTYQPNAQPADSVGRKYASASYAQTVVSFISTTTDTMFRYAARQLAANNPSDTVIVDDGSFKTITRSSLYAILDSTEADITVKVQPDTIVDGTLFGLVVRSSGGADPDNCVYVIARWYDTIDTWYVISVVKKVGSVYTRVLNETIKAIVADAWLEARMSGSTVQIFYNDAQVGGNLTISDAELIDNTYHGLFSSGGNKLKRFFVGA